mmetsp:Transcript_30415/g.71036  ORF Transcript_30415/g.71036 Transcript_30415/m.71036 type:complete len:295 (-) Transcript_30415:37-921(-)
MKWSFLRASLTFWLNRGSLMHSLHSVQSLNLSLTTALLLSLPRSSMSKQPMGHFCTSASASSPSTSSTMSILGSSRYHAVATGLHLACPLSPQLLPLWQCIVRSISCPGLRRVIRMSLCTGSGLSFANLSSCSPMGTHSSCFEKIFELTGSWSLPAPASRMHLTLRRNLTTSVGSSSDSYVAAFVAAEGKLKEQGSTLMGIKPRRCARSSSRSTPLLFVMKTFSMATVGTSDRRSRRSAFAIDTSRPLMSNVISSSVMSRILILNPSFHPPKLNSSSSGKVPLLYVAACLGAVP